VKDANNEKVSMEEQGRSIRKDGNCSINLLSEDSVFQGNPILQTETVFERAQEEQKEILSQTGGTPMVATMTSDNESRKLTASPFNISQSHQ
jgi:hypothetical protein